MTVVVPKTSEAWHQEQPFRVEYLNRSIGSRAMLYFSDLASAREFASQHTIWNQPCVVQSSTMVATHEVHSFSLSEPTYVFARKQFGDVESARAEFNRAKQSARKHRCGLRLVEIGRETPIASFNPESK